MAWADNRGLRHGQRLGSAAALVGSILLLGESLGLRIVAEGVETASSLQQLRDLSCAAIQGYHIGHPVTAAEITADLRFADTQRSRLAVLGR